MKAAERYHRVLSYLEFLFPNAETELHYENAYQLLVAVVLSAQCTDKRVNLVTPALFRQYPTMAQLALATVEEVFEIIKSISYPNNKSRHLVNLGKQIQEQFNGQIPMTVAELITLPGVGRKTAHVVTSVIDRQPKMAVDTHVFRVSNRLGLTKNAKTVLQSENQLIKYIPKHQVHQAHHWLILFGRRICTARSPKCASCGLNDICPFYRKQVLPNLKD